MPNGDKIWVEAEQVAPLRSKSGRGKLVPSGVVLTVVDIAERRRLAEKYGRHNVYTSFERIRNFPPRYKMELREGYPVRFKMYREAFEAMLAGGVPRLETFAYSGRDRKCSDCGEEHD